MFTRRLGRSNLEVTAMGIGCWAIGGPWKINGEAAGWGQMDDKESLGALQYAREAGINFFDTAANYGCGHSERLLGQALRGRRDSVILATKFGYLVDEQQKLVVDSQDVVGHIQQDCENSLRRLGTDYIDLYQFHVNRYDPARAGEVRDRLEELVGQGKIRWYGWSTDNPEGARVFAQGEHCTAIQHTLNMKFVAAEVLQACEEMDQASVNRYPLASGLISDKFSSDTTFPENDFRHDMDLHSDWAQEWFRQREELKEAFAGGKRTLPQVALAWIWARSARTIPIPGFRTLAQVQENIRALEYGPLSSEEVNKIETILGRAPAA